MVIRVSGPPRTTKEAETVPASSVATTQQSDASRDKAKGYTALTLRHREATLYVRFQQCRRPQPGVTSGAGPNHGRVSEPDEGCPAAARRNSDLSGADGPMSQLNILSEPPTIDLAALGWLIRVTLRRQLIVRAVLLSPELQPRHARSPASGWCQ